MRYSLRSLSLFILSLLAVCCQKDVSYTGGPDGFPIFNQPISSNLQGTVLDESGAPATGATVVVGTKTSTTDARGHFRINDAALDRQTSLVTVSKPGYFKAFRVFAAGDGSNNVVVKLISKTVSGNIGAAAGGSVLLSNGTKITLPANAVVNAATGAAYTGAVRVYAAYIDPTASDIGQTVPGSFLANNSAGQRVLLASFGMVAVELESSTGEKLQIKSGSKAVLTTPIPASRQASAPTTIALWSVNETTGLWEEEGAATRSGGVYTGEVSHFSFWNCDAPLAITQIAMRLLSPDGTPQVHRQVRISTTGSAPATTHAYTDSLGRVSGGVPRNEALRLDVLDECQNVVHTQAIGPFSSATDLGDITVSFPVNRLVVSGTVTTCSGAPAGAGSYAMVMLGYETKYVKVNAAGAWTTDFWHCNTSLTTVAAKGIDSAGGVEGDVVLTPITRPATHVGMLAACGTSSAQFFNYTVNGVAYTINNGPTDSLGGYVSGTAAPYTTNLRAYRSTTERIFIQFQHPLLIAGTYAVTSIGVNDFNGTTPVVPLNTIITSFPSLPGQFYEGTISGSFADNTGTVRNLAGSFRIRRD